MGIVEEVRGLEKSIALLSEAADVFLRESQTVYVTISLSPLLKIVEERHHLSILDTIGGIALASIARRRGWQEVPGSNPRRYRAAHPRYIWCPKHRCRATVVVVKVNTTYKVFAKHWFKGISMKCYVGSYPEVFYLAVAKVPMFSRPQISTHVRQQEPG